jgi:hypothetical protein
VERSPFRRGNCAKSVVDAAGLSPEILSDSAAAMHPHPFSRALADPTT